MSSTLPWNTSDLVNITTSNLTISENGTSLEYIAIIAVPVYCVIMFVSSIGNALVLAVVRRNENKRMRTTVNYFIVNMCCSDLLITFCNIPLVIYINASKSNVPLDGILGKIYCGMTTLAHYTSIEVSLMSLVGITVDRFLAVFYPFKKFITNKRAAVLISVIWLAALGFTTPLAAHSIQLKNEYFKVCDFGSVSLTSRIAFVLTGFVVFVVLPLLIMVILYSSIIVKLIRQKPPGESSAINQENISKRNRRVLFMLVIVVTFTAACWLPYFSMFVHCTLSLTKKRNNRKMCYRLGRYFQVLALTNCALNPCIYVIFIENFRNGFYKILRAVCCCIRLKTKDDQTININELRCRPHHRRENQPL